ncbi:alpha amylase C-terminal domain-containing protein [Jeotgalibaca caeni]|uniref:alpha amylase C-terminal domain-containing protein n=1 Tax=Jeotgalibaca caeni TaxID=3028623 RepID=UPI00237EDE64|nr:alpha amylase C-terminal domain-containing protein [Jeotgalibaca caeni]MDE1549566.1 alpha amylase C-terminal domain-containing protein [Jeotgalibaca caeni]
MRDKNHPESIYRFYQDLLLVRKALPVVFQGDFQLLWQEDEKLFAYCREDSSQKLFVICNFTDQDYWLTEKEMPVSLTDATVLLTNRIAPRDNLEHLEPFEATVYQWKK